MYRRLVTAPIIDEISIGAHFDRTAATKAFAATDASYQKAAGDALELGPAQHTIGELDRALRRFGSAVQAGNVARDPANAHHNRPRAHPWCPSILRASPVSEMIAQRQSRLPTLSAANEVRTMPKELKASARMQLTRGQYRDVAAMRDAIKLIATAV